MPWQNGTVSGMADEPTEPATPLADDPEHGGVTDTDLERAAAAQFSHLSTETTVETPSASTEDGAQTETTVEDTTTTEPAVGDDVWEYDEGLKITRDQAKSFAEFQQFLVENPEIAEAVYGVVAGSGTGATSTAPTPTVGAPEPTTAAEPPADLDLDDPVQARLWQELQSVRQEIATVRSEAANATSVLDSQAQANSTALINRAKASYQQQHNLTAEEMAEIDLVAGRLGVLPALLAPVDHVTGVPRKADPLRALETAYDLAAWQIPKIRDAQIAAFQEQARESATRKRKLSSLGGSSGSVPRQQQEVPSDPKARYAAMVDDVANMLRGNFVHGEE
jgi:hypothetical protein